MLDTLSAHRAKIALVSQFVHCEGARGRRSGGQGGKGARGRGAVCIQGQVGTGESILNGGGRGDGGMRDEVRRGWVGEDQLCEDV